MNARFLATLCAVVDLGGLNAAARHLGLSSAAISEQMRTLEKELNAQLIRRSGRNITLTDAGQAILPTAREILKRVDDMKQLAQLDQPKGILRLGAAATAMISILPPALRFIAEHHPDIELKIYPGSSSFLYNQLEENKLDCIITGKPPFSLPKRMTWTHIRDEPLTLICPPSVTGDNIHRILESTPFIRMDKNSWVGQKITKFLEDNGIKTKDIFEMDAQEAIVILVAEGVGVSLLPDWGMTTATGLKLRRITIDNEKYDRSVGIIGIHAAKERLTNFFTKILQKEISPKI